MIQAFKTLNDSILVALTDKTILAQFKHAVLKEKAQIFPDDHYIRIFSEILIENEVIRKHSEILINIEKPSVYVLFDCLVRYLEEDHLAEPIRVKVKKLVVEIP